MTASKRVTQRDLAAFAQELKQEPNTWKPIPSTAKNHYVLVSRQRRGEIPTLPPPHFHAHVIDGTAYCCYIPEGE